MKWNTSSVPAEGSLCVSSAKGLLRAKLLWVSRIKLELERASPRSGAGKEAVKSLKVRSSGPMSMLVVLAVVVVVVLVEDNRSREGLEASLLRMMESTA